MPRATEHIPEIIDITQGLIERGHAYASGGDVYFNVTTDPGYGKLSHRDFEELEAGARIDPGDKKRNPGDFALWKGSKPGEPAWDSPWGPGRPGWHIECSAMSMKLLGPHFDIHGGGLDLVFPHHENEVAQSECYTGQTFATYWLHNGLLTKGGRKISKSDPETIVEMRDLLSRHHPDTIRALLLSSHYRRPIDYSNNRLDELDRALRAFRTFFDRFERIAGRSFYEIPVSGQQSASHQVQPVPDQVLELKQQFLEAMDDDFNTGGALGVLFDLLRVLNRFADENALETAQDSSPTRASFLAGVSVLRELSVLLGLFRTSGKTAGDESTTSDRLTAPLVDLLIELRASLRKSKNFALSDEIRDRLAALGVTLEDGPGGTRWKIES